MRRAFWEGKGNRESREEKRDREQFADIFWAVEWIECSRSLERFAANCKTKDEHAGSSGFGSTEQAQATEIWEMMRKREDETVRFFPSRSEKSYVWHLLDRCLTEKLLLVEKSRQLLVTWSMCLYALWTAKFKNNRLVFLSSKKEEDAANLVFNKDPNTARISFIEAHLPDELRSVDFAKDASYGQIHFSNGSRIWGVPEGGDIIRSYTASLVITDEAAFQVEFENAFAAALPTVHGGGQLVAVSTVWPGSFFQQLRNP